VGGGVAILGGLLVYSLTEYCHIEANTAYFIQAFVALQLNFILNNSITWRDRQALGFWHKWWRFHVTKVVAVILNQILFGLCLLVGLSPVMAYIICTILVMVVNYFSNDRLVFLAKTTLSAPSLTQHNSEAQGKAH
jgi:putative flippase GtrA